VTDLRAPGVELVVLLSPDGQPIGTADKATVHGPVTPYHLAFSCYAFDRSERLLVTQRARSKPTFPGVWTNTCCGHPAPGERPEDAAVRRLEYELRLAPYDLRIALPDFSYRAQAGGVEEHELCPVFLCRIDGDPTPNPLEVAAFEWRRWDGFVAEARSAASRISPWAQLQISALEEGGHVQRFLAQIRTSGSRGP
jgi:isopentenyl-diphosphate delta-isomerase